MHPDAEKQVAMGLAGPGLIAIGQVDLVRRAMDRAREGGRGAEDITSNDEMMNLIKDNAGSTAWVVGHFDAMRRRMRLPSDFCAAGAARAPRVDEGAHQRRHEGHDSRGSRRQSGGRSTARCRSRVLSRSCGCRAAGSRASSGTLKSIELSGTDKTVQMSFALSPETLRMSPRPAPARPAPESPLLEPGARKVS